MIADLPPTSDTATSFVFPLGRFVFTFFTKYNDERPEQKTLDRAAVGHYRS